MGLACVGLHIHTGVLLERLALPALNRNLLDPHRAVIACPDHHPLYDHARIGTLI